MKMTVGERRACVVGTFLIDLISSLLERACGEDTFARRCAAFFLPPYEVSY